MKKLEFYATKEVENYLSLSISDIEKIYKGMLDCCACGCEGTYTYPSDSLDFGLLLEQFKLRRNKVKLTYYDYQDGSIVVELRTTEKYGLRLYFKGNK